MSADQPTEQVFSWLEQSDHFLPRGSRSARFLTRSTSRERSRGLNTEENVSNLLEGSHQEYRSHNELPNEISLPDSHPSHSTHRTLSTDENVSRNSLDDILGAEEPEIPYSMSFLESSIRSEETSTGTQKQGARQPYEKTLENAASVLDHIRTGNVCKRSRHDRTFLIYYDFSKDLRLGAKVIRDARDIRDLGEPPLNVHRRLLIVEDLSKSTILALGETFCINPEFFEEHLLNSGYAGAEYDMLPAKMWTTAALERSYVSTKWIRPVYRLPMYSWNYNMQDLARTGHTDIKSSSVSDMTVENSTEKRHIEHFTPYGTVKTRLVTNILRPESRLWMTSERERGAGRECGLEERVSVWKGNIPNRDCEIVIMLVDPLPAVEEQHPGPETKDIHWENSRTDTDPYDTEADSDLELSGVDTDSAERGIAHMVFEAQPPPRETEPLLIQWGRSIMELMGRRNAQARYASLDLDLQKELPLQKVIVKQICPRHVLPFDLDRVFQSEDSTKSFETSMSSASTLNGLCDEIEHYDGPISLGSSLFYIIKQDTLTFLRQLSHHSLDENEIGVLDEVAMETRLAGWVQAIHSAQKAVSELHAAMEPFAVFCASLDSTHTSESSTASEPEVMCDFQELSKIITQMSDRLERTSALLTTNMGLLESRRSINEAQAVSRLTELAFVFVPLSFAASIFGMQIEPFADPVPLRSFFIVAVGVTMFAYFMRMTMRSQWLAYLKIKLRQDVRRYAESHGLPVPTRSIPILLTGQWIGGWIGLGIKKVMKTVRRTWRRIWGVLGFVILFVLLNGSVSVVPLAILWTQDLNPGIQCAVSIAIFLIVFCCVGVPFWHWSNPRFRSALPKLLLRIIRRYPPQNLRLLLFSGMTTTVMIIALVMIWVRPLAFGIKSGLTAGLLIFVIPAICGILLRRLLLAVY